MASNSFHIPPIAKRVLTKLSSSENWLVIQVARRINDVLRVCSSSGRIWLDGVNGDGRCEMIGGHRINKRHDIRSSDYRHGTHGSAKLDNRNLC